MQAIQLTVEHYQATDGGHCKIEGLGVFLYAPPSDIRQLARQLNQIANDADQGATGTIQYPVEG